MANSSTPAPWSGSSWDFTARSVARRCDECDRVFTSEEAFLNHEHLIAASKFGVVDERKIAAVRTKPCPASRKGVEAARAMDRFNPPPGPLSSKVSAVLDMMAKGEDPEPQPDDGHVAKASSAPKTPSTGKKSSSTKISSKGKKAAPRMSRSGRELKPGRNQREETPEPEPVLLSPTPSSSLKSGKKKEGRGGCNAFSAAEASSPPEPRTSRSGRAIIKPLRNRED